MNEAPADIEALRAKLSSGKGPTFWRSLDAVADTAEFRAFLSREFPALLPPVGDRSRRRFLQLMAASFAMAGLTACSRAPRRDEEVPYVRNPSIEPGTNVDYASCSLQDGFANGVLVRTQNARPIKIEGNPDHPFSRGGTDVFAQASVLDLYDPARSQAVLYLSRPSSWAAFAARSRSLRAAWRENGGRGVRILSGPVTSPTFAAQIAALKGSYPNLVWHALQPVGRAGAYAAARQTFGRALETRLRFDKAQVVLALDGDFLDPGPHQTGVARDWADARRTAADQGRLLETYAAATMPTLTSAKADLGQVMRADALEAFARGLLAAIDGGAKPAESDRWQHTVFERLMAARGASIVTAGAYAPLTVQVLAHQINARLGNVGGPVFYTAPAIAPAETVDALLAEMRGGTVETLVMLDVNPAYDLPAGAMFEKLLGNVPLKIHAGLHVDETAASADWHLPLAHTLESWGDARAFDGTISFYQPTVAPLYGGKSAGEILSILTEDVPRSGHDILYQAQRGGADDAAFAPRWTAALQAGFLADTALPPVDATPLGQPLALHPTTTPSGLQALIRPDPTIWDGRAANNAWLQELPKPLTKLTWDNVVAVAPKTAQAHDLKTGDVVAVEAGGRHLEGPVWIQPGLAPNAVGLTLGYGRRAPGGLSFGLGFDTQGLRASEDDWLIEDVTLRKLDRHVALATTQDRGTMEGQDLIRSHPVGAPAPAEAAAKQSFYKPKTGNGRAWGMVIDTDTCIGCNACVTACQAENNIAVVGRDEVAKGRALHWLRIDRYYEGPLDAPQTHFMPVPCMHCEEAPCEVGCPVEATLHDSEGLNLMVYNRCIGTRACSSYCPYKVRHFNYFDYAASAAPGIEAQRNPDVSVRAAGVMEKCTYCVQRIAAARIDADMGEGHIADGAVTTACQGACPTRAITFGDLADTGSAVAAARRDARNYTLLDDLALKPHTTYLARRAPAKDA